MQIVRFLKFIACAVAGAALGIGMSSWVLDILSAHGMDKGPIGSLTVASGAVIALIGLMVGWVLAGWPIDRQVNGEAQPSDPPDMFFVIVLSVLLVGGLVLSAAFLGLNVALDFFARTGTIGSMLAWSVTALITVFVMLPGIAWKLVTREKIGARDVAESMPWFVKLAARPALWAARVIQSAAEGLPTSCRRKRNDGHDHSPSGR